MLIKLGPVTSSGRRCTLSYHLIIIVTLVSLIRTSVTHSNDNFMEFHDHLRRFLKGEPRPPFLNRIVRVSRGPNVPSSTEEFQNFLKSPAYQLRFRPNRLSHFHSYAVLNGLSPSANGLNILNIPGMAAINSINPHVLHGHGNLPYGRSGLDELQTTTSSAENEPKQPTFTPLISARALSNMGKFFEHLRENIDALHKDKQHEQHESKQGDESAEGYGEDDDNGKDFKDFDWQDSGESDFGSNFQDYLNRQALALKWQQPHPLASSSSAGNHEKFVPSRLDDSELKRAPGSNPARFNPAWIKMGLGR